MIVNSLKTILLLKYLFLQSYVSTITDIKHTSSSSENHLEGKPDLRQMQKLNFRADEIEAFEIHNALNPESDSLDIENIFLVKEQNGAKTSRVLASNSTQSVDSKRTVHYFELNGSKRHNRLYERTNNITNFNSSDEQIHLNQTYRLIAQNATYEQSENTNDTASIVIEILTEGKLVIDIFADISDLSKPNITELFPVDSTMVPLFIILDSKYFQNQKNGFTIRNSLAINVQPLIFRTRRASFIDTSFETKIHINSKFSEAFNFKISMPQNWEDTSSDNRLQFVVNTNLENQFLDGNEYLALFINKDLPFPTKDKYDISTSGVFEDGIVKTLSNKNSAYCMDKSCVYYATIYSQGINSYVLFPAINKNGAILSLTNGICLMEELEPNEEIYYEIQVPKKDHSLVFSLIPTENEIEVLMNPDHQPQLVSEYKYIISSNAPEEIIITKDEASNFNYTMNKFFVKYKSVANNLTSTFKFEIKSIHKDEPIKLISDITENGLASPDELIQFFINFSSSMTELATISLRLNSLEGEANLYLKECPTINMNQCSITKADIKGEGHQKLAGDKLNENPMFLFTNSKFNELNRFNNTSTLQTKINCLNGGDRKAITNSSPISETCLFAVAVHNKKSFNGFSTFYKLLLKMENAHQEISDREIVSMRIDADEEKNYFLRIKNSEFNGNLTVKFRLVAISGICSLYFSQTSKFPNENENEEKIKINDENTSFLHTEVYNTSISVKESHNDEDRFVYITVKGQEFCIFDLNSEIQTKGGIQSKIEIIRYNQLYVREIEENSKVVTDSNTTYYKILEVRDGQETQGIQVMKEIMITLNSPISGLKLCVQYNVTEFSFDRKCNLESYNDFLHFYNLKLMTLMNGTYFIGVQKTVSANETFTRLPIEFSIILGTSINQNQFELVQPGRTFFGHVDAFNSITVWIDLSKMKNSGMVFFESEDPLIRVDVYGNSHDDKTTLTILDPYKFGLYIPDATAYRANFCRSKCVMKALIYTMGQGTSHFALTYTVDNYPIVIKEGNLLTVPNNVPLYFVYDFEKTDELNFNFVTEGPSSVAYSKMISKTKFAKNMLTSKAVGELKYDFKTDIDNSLQVVYPPLMLENENESVALFLVEPKFNARQMKNVSFINEFEPEDRAKVYVQAKTLKLDPFNPFKDDVLKGEFKYFTFDIASPQDFSLILSLMNGEAEMYLGKGVNEFPTLKRFWKKTKSCHGDSIVVDKNSMENAHDIVGTYIIGIYGKSNTAFTILWLPDFKNLIKVKFQTIIDMKLEKGKNYFFDFYNKQDDFSSLLYIDDSDVEVSVLDFDKKKSQDISSMLANEANYAEHFVYRKNELPRDHITTNDNLYGKHIILRMKATEAAAHANLLIYNSTEPINGPANKRFHFVLNKSKEAVFLIQLDNTYEEVDIDIKLDFGKIDVSPSNTNSDFTRVVNFGKASQKTLNFDLSKKMHSKDILIFKQLYLRVRAYQFSRFAINVHPKNMFKPLKPLQPEIIYPDSDKETYLFYGINQNNMPTIKDFEFDLNLVSFFGERPEMLFLPDDNQEAPSEDSKFSPMPLNDISERNSDEYRQILIKPEIHVGNYILKIAKSPNKLPVKVSVVLNHQKGIENNGLYKGVIAKEKIDSNQYSMYISQPGEFRLVLESCANVTIDSVNFTDTSGSRSLLFNDDLQQSYPYIVVDEQTNTATREFKKITYPVRRGMVDSQGNLKFKVSPIQSGQSPAQNDAFYVLMSEFRPQNKELILKDYIEIFNEGSSDSKNSFKYEFFDNYRKLQLSVKMPSFKPQLLLDYPDLKKVLIKFNFYLFSDKDIQDKIATCGLSAMNQIKNVPFSVLKTVDRDTIANWATNKTMIDALFVESNLELFRDVSTLNVLCYVSVRFFENEDDEWQVSLDLKFANAPYFLLILPNKYLSNFLLITCSIVVFGILFFILSYWVIKRCRSPYTEVLGDIRMKNDISYIAPSMQSEISNFSVEI